jgi:hypothetical protein
MREVPIEVRHPGIRPSFFFRYMPGCLEPRLFGPRSFATVKGIHKADKNKDKHPYDDKGHRRRG